MPDLPERDERGEASLLHAVAMAIKFGMNDTSSADINVVGPDWRYIFAARCAMTVLGLKP